MAVLVRYVFAGRVGMLMLRGAAGVGVLGGHGRARVLLLMGMLMGVLVGMGVRMFVRMHQVAVPVLMGMRVGVGVRMFMLMRLFHNQFSRYPRAQAALRPLAPAGLTPVYALRP
jgi:hypothetical protein